MSLTSASPSRFGAILSGSLGAWAPRVLALLVWGGVAATAAYWWLSLGAHQQAVPAHAQVSGLDSALRGDIARLFGERSGGAPAEAPTPPAVASRFKVVGVAGSPGGATGVAMLSIDGRPAKAYAVGAAVEGDWVLQSATQKRVHIGPSGGAPLLVLELQALPPAATGQLPAGGEGAALPGAPVPGAPGLRPPVGGVGVGAVGQMPTLPVQAPPPMQLLPQVRPDGSMPPQDAASPPVR